MVKIYIVTGHTGEYSDQSSWNVCGFTDRQAAIDRITALEKVYLQFQMTASGYSRPKDEADRLSKAMEPLDPNFYEDYTGTRWNVDECDFGG